MTRDDGGPAFPSQQGETAEGTWNQTYEPGLSLRDYFAAKAMQAIVANDAFYKRLMDIVNRGECPYDRTPDAMAHTAYEMADSMLQHRTGATP